MQGSEWAGPNATVNLKGLRSLMLNFNPSANLSDQRRRSSLLSAVADHAH
jgi:hypothetical protein